MCYRKGFAASTEINCGLKKKRLINRVHAVRHLIKVIPKFFSIDIAAYTLSLLCHVCWRIVNFYLWKLDSNWVNVFSIAKHWWFNLVTAVYNTLNSLSHSKCCAFPTLQCLLTVESLRFGACNYSLSVWYKSSSSNTFNSPYFNLFFTIIH